MTTQHKLPYFLTTAFLAAALGCQPDDSSPTGPSVSNAPEVESPDLAVAAAGWVVRRDMPGGTRYSVATAAVTQNGNSVLYVIGGGASSRASLSRGPAHHPPPHTSNYYPQPPPP